MLTAPTARLAVILGLLVTVAAAWAAPMTWTLGGYVQARFTEDFGTLGTGDNVVDNPSSFRAVRPSLVIRAFDGEHVYLQFFFSVPTADNDVEVQHAFAEYQVKPFYARLGLSPIPFGYENPVTSAALVTTERSQVSNTLIGPFALDRGLFAFYLPTAVGKFNVSAGAVNGEPYTVNSDSNTTKTIVGRVGYYLTGGEVGLSIYEGVGPNGATMDRVGADVRLTRAPFTVIAEYIAGTTGTLISENIVDVDANGFYITLAYRQAGSDWMPYIRYDAFDRNENAGGDFFSRGTGGVSYYLNPTSKLQAEFETINDGVNPDLDGRFTAQYQIIF